MEKKRIWAVLAALLAVLTTTQAVAEFQIEDICVGSHDSVRPDISGSIIVWADGRDGGFNIYGCELSEPEDGCFLIYNDDGSQEYPRIDGSLVVWENNDKVYVYDMDDEEQGVFLVGDPSSEKRTPAVSGNIIIWRDRRDGDWNIYGYDLSKEQGQREFAVTDDSANQLVPDIDGDIVVWHDTRDGVVNIYGYDLAAGKEFEICINEDGNQLNPRVSGNIVVWQDGRESFTETDIYGYNLDEGYEFVIAEDSVSQSHPAIHDDLVVWVEAGNIYGYDLSTDQEFLVYDETDGANYPAVYGNQVVFQSNNDILMARRQVTGDLELLSPDGGQAWMAGNTEKIEWSSTGNIETIKLEYSTDDGDNWVTIADSVDNSGSFSWQIPETDSTQCLVRISEPNTPDIMSESQKVFEIFTCDPALTADLTGNCEVEMADFAVFAEQWLTSGRNNQQ